MSKTRFILLSDSHKKLNQVSIPDGDILIHCGDLTGLGTWPELQEVNRDFAPLKKRFKRILYIPGNHDSGFEKDFARAEKIISNAECIHDRKIEIEGISIYGNAYTPEFGRWYFTKPRGEELKKIFDKIPKVDILVTHGPCYGILDKVPRGLGYEHAGSEELLDRVSKIRPVIHSFGHLHDGAMGGSKLELVEWPVHNGDGTKTLFINAAILNDKYEVAYEPIVLDIEKVGDEILVIPANPAPEQK